MVIRLYIHLAQEIEIIFIEVVRNSSAIDSSTELDRTQDEDSIEEEIKLLEETFGSSVHAWFKGYIKFLNNVIMK